MPRLVRLHGFRSRLATICLWLGSVALASVLPDAAAETVTAVGPAASFEAISPAEFHVPTNRQVVRTEIELRNTSRCCLCLATWCCGQWRCGLVPSWSIEFADGDGPLLRESVILQLAKLSGNRVCPGKSACPVELEFRLKEGVSEGDRETFRLTLSLTNPRTGTVQSADWALDVVVRRSGAALLISEKIPFPSEQGE